MLLFVVALLILMRSVEGRFWHQKALKAFLGDVNDIIFKKKIRVKKGENNETFMYLTFGLLFLNGNAQKEFFRLDNLTGCLSKNTYDLVNAL